MSVETKPYSSWIRHIPGTLYQLDETPLLGFPPAFSWEAFSQQLVQSLQIKDIVISPGNLEWLPEGELFKGLGDRLKTLSLTVSPLAGSLWWVMPEQALSHLMHLLLAKDSKTWAETIDESFYKAFYQFFAAEVINAFEKVGFDKKISPSVNREVSLPSEACLGLDVSIAVGQEHIHGRLLLSQTFRKSWAQHFSQGITGLPTSSPLTDSLNVLVRLEAGSIDLKPSEWQQIRPGDFVIPDKCSLDPDEDKGRVMLVINDTPFFRGRIKNGSLKILEHPLYHEVNTAMEPPAKHDDHEESFNEEIDDDFEFDDEDLDHSESDVGHETGGEGHSEADLSAADHSLHGEDDATSHGEHTDEHTGEHPSEEEHTALGEDDLDISDEDLDEVSEAPVKPAAPSKTKDKQAGATAEKAALAEKSAAKPAPKPVAAATPSSKPLSVEEIPLNVVIEVGRIQLSVKKLLELQPGNMLDINIHPESGVDLVVNGKRIAHGELLKIGDSLGIRILELS